MASSSSSSYNSPCAACKFLSGSACRAASSPLTSLRRTPQKFANVHKIFGASNVSKLLNDLLPHQREDAVNSLAYEAEARVRDPVYGCVGAISYLQRQVHRLQKELDAANADLVRYACTDIPGYDSFQGAGGFYGQPSGGVSGAGLDVSGYPHVPWVESPPHHDHDNDNDNVNENGGSS